MDNPASGRLAIALLSSRSDGRDYAKGALEPNVAGDQWSEKQNTGGWGDGSPPPPPQSNDVRPRDDSAKGAWISANILETSGGGLGGAAVPPRDVRPRDDSAKGCISATTVKTSGGVGGGGSPPP